MPSTAIEHIGYDEAAGELHVSFLRAATYTYYAVPREVYVAFAPTSRKGKFFGSRIKDRYGFRRHT